VEWLIECSNAIERQELQPTGLEVVVRGLLARMIKRVRDRIRNPEVQRPRWQDRSESVRNSKKHHEEGSENEIVQAQSRARTYGSTKGIQTSKS
jgi:hypothetical protein